MVDKGIKDIEKKRLMKMLDRVIQRKKEEAKNNVTE